MDNKERDLELLNKLVIDVKRDMDKLNVPYNDIVPFKINNRLSRALGRCIYKRINNEKVSVLLEIQGEYFKNGSINDIKDTICHELIHSAKDCVNSGHIGIWKKYADIMTLNSKYNIKRTQSVKIDVDESKYKYKVVCSKCGVTTYKKRKSKLIEHPEYFRCKCGCKKLNVEILR